MVCNQDTESNVGRALEVGVAETINKILSPRVEVVGDEARGRQAEALKEVLQPRFML